MTTPGSLNRCINRRLGESSARHTAARLHLSHCTSNGRASSAGGVLQNGVAAAPACRSSTTTDGGGVGGAGGTNGSGAGGKGGSGGSSGGGNPQNQPPFRLSGSTLLAALLSYVGFLVAAATAWDALLDATVPKQDTGDLRVSVIIPVLNEAAIIEKAVRHAMRDLHPPPCEVIVVDGGSTDGTPEAARRAGARVVRSDVCGRGFQMNAGAEVARGEVLVFLHADTQLPDDALAEVKAALADPRTVLVGFRPDIQDQGKTLWFSSLNNMAKTWYGPIVMRPASYVRGLRCIFGDQALSCRARDLQAVGGFRADIPFMEDAELSIALHMAGPADKSLHRGRGRVRMLLRHPAVTSGRRIAAWGELRANAVFAYISLLWLAGASPAELHATYKRLYGDVR